MASFPTSPHTFTNFSNGALSDAAQVTDIYGEVEAIEAGLLNGTARLNSSNSTVANLSVTGGSTFATRPVFTPPNCARVFLQNAYDCGSSAVSTLTFVAEDFVVNSSIHSTTTNPERLTPQTTGVYEFKAQFTMAGVPSARSHVRVAIRDSSLTVLALQGGESTSALSLSASGLKRFDVTGGYVIVTADNISGGSTMSISTGVGLTWFSMVKL